VEELRRRQQQRSEAAEKLRQKLRRSIWQASRTEEEGRRHPARHAEAKTAEALGRGRVVS